MLTVIYEVINLMSEHNWIGLEGFEPDPKKHFGFIYLITNKNGQKYIGSKQFWSKRKESKKSDPKYGKFVVKESKWKMYQSSNKIVQGWASEEIEKKVICICGSKFELSYREIEALIKTKALLREDFENYMMGSNTIGRPPTYMILSKCRRLKPSY